ncbi:hypothetical protein N9682_04985 [Candidatus Pelagibacter sp.]|nr:hypothetical protein [Candidatus Pelagibacter sp.]
MRIKKSSLDTILILFAMLAAAAPTVVAKPLVALSLCFILLRVIAGDDKNNLVSTKILIYLLFLPGILGAIFVAPQNLVRFFGIMLIILGFPFSSFNIKQFPIVVTSALILIFLSVTQILLLHENQLILDFRDFGYRDVHASLFDNYGYVENIFRDILDYFKDNYIRAGGLYFNPNVLAVVLLLNFFIFDISWENNNQITGHNKKNFKRYIIYTLIISLVIFSIILTKSRTVVIALIAYLIFKNFNFEDLLRLKFKKKLIMPILLSIIILYIFLERILVGLLNPTGSANIKILIFFNYIRESSLPDLLFGGTFNVNFDTEYGNWLGASGFLCLFAFFIFYRMMYGFSNQSKALLISLLVISIGNTLFYNLLFAAILVPMFIILLSFNNLLNNHK